MQDHRGIQPGIDYQLMAGSSKGIPDYYPPPTFLTPKPHTWHQVPHPKLNPQDFHNARVHVLRTVIGLHTDYGES